MPEPTWPPPPKPEAELQPWSTAEVRRRHGEVGPVRRGRCGFRRPNGSVCARTRALAEINTIESMRDGGRQWEMGHCKDHLSDAERDFLQMVDRVSRYEDAVIRVSGFRLLDEIDRLEAGELQRISPDQPPMPGLPACWEWMRHDVESQAASAVVVPKADTLRGMWEWQDGRCALCGFPGVTDLDHDHWSGLVRGFLCHSCNLAGAEDGAPGRPYWPVISGQWSRYRQLNPARWLRLRMSYNAAQYEQRWGLDAAAND